MKIIYETETGIAIIHTTGELSIEEVFEKDVPKQYKASAQIVEDNAIINDRYFRDAWELKNGKVVENLDKAKEIHKEKLREERKPLLEKLDVDYMRALERNEETKFIISEKTRLRQITDKVNSCKTIEDIRKVKI